MKCTAATAIAILGFTSGVLAQHKHHARQAKADRRGEPVEKRAVETKVIYQTIIVDQDGIPWSESTSTAVAESTSTTVAESNLIQESQVISEASSYSVPVTTSTSATSSAAVPVSSSDTSDVVFPDGTIDCGSFPSAYGALPLDYLGFDGWSGIQLDDGTSEQCTEGAYCSYACSPGYSKSQWPATQPASGESLGGLLCSGGKLYLTRSEVNTLCIAGVGSAALVNNLSESVAVCRTDYPGSENMVIPVSPASGKTAPLTVVDSDTYYIWEGGSTSAQYYVNNAGVSVEDGCLWGTSSGTVGNWAPLNFGAGFKDGYTWISMFPNPLANGAKANYNVKIVATSGSTINGECTYIDGVFSTDGGCTVCVTSGSAEFVFYD